METKPFNEVYSQEQIDEVDKRIMEAKRNIDITQRMSELVNGKKNNE